MSRWKQKIRNHLIGKMAYSFAVRQWRDISPESMGAFFATTMLHEVIEPVPLPLPTGRVLVIAPHPDDEVLGCGGTLIKAIKAGAAVTVYYQHTHGKLYAPYLEAQAVARMVGYETTTTMPDMSHFQAVFVPFLTDGHADHRAANLLLLDFPDNMDVWAYQVYGMLPGNGYVDITTVADEKAHAMSLFSSQMEYRDWIHWILGANAYNSRWLPRGEAVESKYVELFFSLPTKEYKTWIRKFFNISKAE